MADYKIGDWLIDKQTKQVFVIAKIWAYPSHFELHDVQDMYNKAYVPTERIYNEYSKLAVDCPVARVLYTRNSNKAVTNETNEE
jgi:hypothetical protein